MACSDFDNMENISHYASEEDYRAEKLSIPVRAPKVNKSIRDKSCIIIFPKGISQNRLTRASVEEMMSEQWGDLYKHVINFGTINFARKWIFSFDTEENNNEAVKRDIFINRKKVKAFHATKKFNELKVDYIPLWTCLDDLAQIIKTVAERRYSQAGL